jgi:hypothetical protein
MYQSVKKTLNYAVTELRKLNDNLKPVQEYGVTLALVMRAIVTLAVVVSVFPIAVRLLGGALVSHHIMSDNPAIQGMHTVSSAECAFIAVGALIAGWAFFIRRQPLAGAGVLALCFAGAILMRGGSLGSAVVVGLGLSSLFGAGLGWAISEEKLAAQEEAMEHTKSQS